MQTARRQGWPNYRIVEPDSQGRLVPAAKRDAYYPIWYAASKCGFEAKFGWDFAADPVLQTAIDKCRNSGDFVVSDLIDLRNIGLHPRMLQTFLPVYRDFNAVHTPAERRTHLEGLLVGLCQVDDLVDSALNYMTGPQGIDVSLFDVSVPSDRRLLYCHASRTRHEQAAAATSQAETRATAIHHTDRLTFGGRRWSLVCTPAPSFLAAHTNWRSWTILLIGLSVTCLSAGYTRAAATRTNRIERLVDERTLQLRQKDEQLRQSQEAKARAIRAAHEETIHRLVAASLCRDEETGMHIKRTGLLSECLARAAGWSEADAEILRLAAPMHDVGKIGIPDAILQKPGKLTPAEFEIMKTHTLLGAKMLEGSHSPILVMARDIALCHHERWNGAGYPLRLAGSAIPECGPHPQHRRCLRRLEPRPGVSPGAARRRGPGTPAARGGNAVRPGSARHVLFTHRRHAPYYRREPRCGEGRRTFVAGACVGLFSGSGSGLRVPAAGYRLTELVISDVAMRPYPA